MRDSDWYKLNNMESDVGAVVNQLLHYEARKIDFRIMYDMNLDKILNNVN